MEIAYQATAILSTALVIAFYVWYLWRFHGDEIRAWWADQLGPWYERQLWIDEWRRLYYA